MEESNNTILDSNYIKDNTTRRRKLLPWWIKTFIWIFLALGVFAPCGLLFGLLGHNFRLSLYGLETNNPISTTGIFLLGIFLFKGVTAFGLWTEKDWAVNLGIIDAISGILVCAFVMIVMPFLDNVSGFVFNFRIELFLLVAYLIKLNKLKSVWEENNYE